VQVVTSIEAPLEFGQVVRYMIYAESYRGASHLRRILEVAQTIIGAAPAAPTQ